MANRIVRSIRNVKDIEKQSLKSTEICDLVHTNDDKVYIRLNNEYKEITGMLDQIEQLNKKTNNNKTSLQRYLNRIKKLEEEKAELNQRLDNMNEVLGQILQGLQLDENIPDENVPDENVPDENTPDENTPDENGNENDESYDIRQDENGDYYIVEK